jgi:hypothetical protein
MSLYALPVSVNDLEQLQLGIEFFTNTNEATTEAGLINQKTPTVDSYAVQLLGNNISFSQVAMAASALMEGSTIPVGDANTPNTLTLLSTVFLPPQVANALKFGFDPTVYAAEALGLALSTLPSFQSFVNLNIDQFSQAVSIATGINNAAIQSWVMNWEQFYTAHPQNGTTVAQAAYGAAFGDAVGVALANPTANGTIALLVNEEQNALIDNAEGLYQIGMPVAGEPFHLLLQGQNVFQIPAAGSAVIDWAQFPGAAIDYAQFVNPPQVGPLTIVNTPSTFTLDTQSYGRSFPTGGDVISAAGNGSLFTLVLGDSTSPDSFGGLTVVGYPTVHIVANGPTGVVSTDTLTSLFVNPSALSPDQLVISGNAFLNLGDISSIEAQEGNVSVAVGGGTITDVGVGLNLGVTDAHTIDASHAPFLVMFGPASLLGPGETGVTVLGGSEGSIGTLGGGPSNILQGSLGGLVSVVNFSNASTGVAADFVGADNITGPPGGSVIYGDGGPDTITLPLNSVPNTVVFGEDLIGQTHDVLAITDPLDMAYPGYWGVTGPTAIPTLFQGATGGTSADMATITGFGAVRGDQLQFTLAAWNGASSGIFDLAVAHGDLAYLDGVHVVVAGAAQLSQVWHDSTSNSSLKATDNVLLYAPSDVSVQSAQQLAAQLHTSSDAIVLAGFYIPAGYDRHILVAYETNNAVHIADVDLVNMSASPQNSTANLNVYASDMVSLTGVSLASLTPDNIHFI